MIGAVDGNAVIGVTNRLAGISNRECDRHRFANRYIVVEREWGNGQPGGIYVIQMTSASWFVSAGFYIVTLGTTLLIGTMLWDTILYPILVKQDQSLLDFQGPIYTSRLFLPFFIVAGLIYSLGYILV